MPLIEFTERGFYCRTGDFYIDPWKPVKRAVITHAHSDHARFGHQHYLCHTYTKPILQLRLGAQNDYQSIPWNEPVFMNGVKISLHPAGHIIGSSQVRVEHQGEVWVVSGDYKTENDGISTAFEPVPCHTFITESTFGLPIYQWKPQDTLFTEMEKWIAHNQSRNETSILFAYSLGKAQRLINRLGRLHTPIFVHGAIWNVQEAFREAGWDFPIIQRVTPETPKEAYRNNIVIAPSSAEDSPWLKKFSPYAIGICSGWMQVRGNVRRRNADAGFALSDHADWDGLLHAIKSTGAQRIYVTHGFQDAFSRYLNETQVEAYEVKTEFGNDEEEPISNESQP